MSLVYPPVGHKIPELFSQIIEARKLLDEVVHSSVVKIEDFKTLKKANRNLLIAAEGLYSKGKGKKDNETS